MNDTRIRDAMLVALTVSTGAVDALSWLVLGKVFSAFMTGNVVFLGLDAAGAAGPSVSRVGSSLAAFAAGALLAARIVSSKTDTSATWPRRVTIALGVALCAQAAFLGLWLGTSAHPSSGAGDALIGLSALAMGMQTTAIFALGVRGVFTTAATATWALLMGDFSGWSQSRGERRRLASVITGLFAGAASGALLVLHARTWAPVLPLAVSALVVTGATVAFDGAGRLAGVRPLRPRPDRPRPRRMSAG
ncbi:MAG TPA: YoaK family protein [Solirubrobacteraceae bacterium]|jgi:uncharacterized membrane protein YoaK (UPF0700 family)